MPDAFYHKPILKHLQQLYFLKFLQHCGTVSVDQIVRPSQARLDPQGTN